MLRRAVRMCSRTARGARPVIANAALLLIPLCLAAASSTRAADGAAGVSFSHDVMAAISKAGCNLGTCHGSASGKNGFKLSLRGDDPAADFRALARDEFGRRTNALSPADSLILRKATAAVPHEGGRRFDTDSSAYQTLHGWIAAGMPYDVDARPRVAKLLVSPPEIVLVEPAEELSLKIEAKFTDGTTRDVTSIAVYEPSTSVVAVSSEGQVRRQAFGEATIVIHYLNGRAAVDVACIADRPEFAWRDVPEHNFVDRHVLDKLRRLRIEPSELADEHVFLRRAYVDLLGVLPTVNETREYLADVRPDRRSRLIDLLLQRPEFNDYWALKWSDLVRNEEKVLDRKGVQTLHHWFRQSFAEHKPLDRLAYELIAARGSTYTEPPANFYRAHRDPLTTGEAVAQVFLGVRLQCARCHNHPFDEWTQDDYYHFAGFFARVRYKIVENRRRDRFDNHEFDGEQIVWLARSGEVKNAATGKPATPRMLGESEPLADTEADRLIALAEWVTDSENEMFARMQANRIWYHLLRRGIVDPIDDFQLANSPANRPLLDAITRELVESKFDLRHLIRVIANSRTYQLSSVPTETNAADERNFARAVVQPLEAEVLLDAVAQVMEIDARFNGYPSSVRAGELPGVAAYRDRDRAPTSAEQFLKLFGKPQRSLACECERQTDTTLGQAFQLLSGPLLDEMLSDENNRIGRLLVDGRDDAEIVEEFYLAALCRLPSDEELEAAASYIAAAENRRQAIEDVAAAVLTSKEFLLRR